jgi:hypothetical protein
VPRFTVVTRPVTHTARVAQTTTVPSGGVQAGGGGTSAAPSTPAAAIGLGGTSLALLLGAGGLTAARRR